MTTLNEMIWAAAYGAAFHHQDASYVDEVLAAKRARLVADAAVRAFEATKSRGPGPIWPRAASLVCGDCGARRGSETTPCICSKDGRALVAAMAKEPRARVEYGAPRTEDVTLEITADDPRSCIQCHGMYYGVAGSVSCPSCAPRKA